jgi:PAS domain S-box-containing protein
MILAVLAVVAVATWMRLAFMRQTSELRESEERFRALFENSIEGVYESAPDGGFRRVNPAMARILGLSSPAEVLRIAPDRTAGIYVVPGRRQEFFRQLGSRDHVENFESEIYRPDKSRVWISENVRAIRDGQGKLVRLQGFVTDITARKQASAALQASEERFRVLFEHSPVGIIEYDYREVLEWFERLRLSGVTDLETWMTQHPAELETHGRTRVVGANSAMLRLVGVRTMQEGVANLGRFFTGEVFNARRRIFLALWHGRHEAEGEMSFNAADGQSRRVYYRWWLPSIGGRPMYDRAQLAMVDITAAKSAETALAAERERLSVTLRAMTEGVATTDRHGMVQFMNDAAGELTGWLPAAAIGRPIGEVFVFGAEKAERALSALVADALAADRAVDLPTQTLLRPREGKPRRIDGRCAPMHDLSGRAIGVVLVIRDVTDRSRLEEELLRASKLESIGVLAGGIAHDFNNLLAIVMGNLTIALLDEKVSAAGSKWLREAERGALRARELTQQLLTFAKGGEPLRMAVLLPDVIREAAEFALHGSTARCEFDVAPDLRPADVDKSQIGQVIQNLVINAVQAMTGGGVIKVSLRNDSLPAEAAGRLPAGDYLRIEIADTGKGIAPEQLGHIFEPFFTTKEHGTGLGLATVYSVIQRHHGFITVESTVGKGTTFRMWLPAARSEPPASPQSASPFEPLRGRVLFMDDEEPIRIMTKTLLERLGLEPTMTAEGGEAVREYAIAQVDGRKYDLVIMDLTVPGAMSGADAMREILKIDPNARGIVSSGYHSDPVMANYRAYGFRGMVPKPYRLGDFARTIREVMQGS